MPVTVIDQIAPKNAGDFGVVEDTYLIGGWRTVADITARDAIPAQRRSLQMRVAVVSEGKQYALVGGLLNANWTEVGSSVSAGVPFVTLTAMTAPVDFNDGTAVDPGLANFFQTQQSMNDFLTLNGTSNFKHGQPIWNATPYLADHPLVFSFAGGVQRPVTVATQGGFWAWTFNNKQVRAGSITIQGVASGSWSTFSGLTGLVVDSHQVDSGDPWIDFSVTNPGAFTPRELIGFNIVTSDGLVATINDNTGDRIFLNQPLSPAPTDGVSTVTVATQGTVFRNSLDDLTNEYFFTMLVQGGPLFSVTVNDISIQGFGSLGSLDVLDDITSFNRVIIDDWTPEQAPLSRNGNGYAVNTTNANAQFTGCSFKRTENPNSDNILFGNANSSITMTYCVGVGGQDGIQLGPSTVLRLINCVFDKVSTSIPAARKGMLEFDSLSQVDFFQGNPGKSNEVRNSAATVSGVHVQDSAIVGFNQISRNQHCIFTDCAGACLSVGPGVNIDIEGTGFIDGGGNLDVGIDMQGPLSSISLPSTNDVAGANGDVRLAGVVLTYADIVTNGPMTDADFNHVSKV